MIDQQPAAGAFTGGEAVRGKYGNRHTTSVPSGVATCADGSHLTYGTSGAEHRQRAAGPEGGRGGGSADVPVLVLLLFWKRSTPSA
jgi:hypothetical protein